MSVARFYLGFIAILALGDHPNVTLDTVSHPIASRRLITLRRACLFKCGVFKGASTLDRILVKGTIS